MPKQSPRLPWKNRSLPRLVAPLDSALLAKKKRPCTVSGLRGRSENISRSYLAFKIGSSIGGLRPHGLFILQVLGPKGKPRSL